MNMSPIMRATTLLTLLIFFTLKSFSQPGIEQGNTMQQRGVKVVVAKDAPAEVREAAEQVLAACASHPLLQIMSAGRQPNSLTDSSALLAAKAEARAYDHLILVGMPDDPMITAAWQREARSIERGFFIFGFGYLAGDIGYIESDRNPFLHGNAIAKAPYETEVVTITGSTPAGVTIAAQAFLHRGLVNGVIANAGWRRPKPNLLQHDPLPVDFSLPSWLKGRIGEATCIGVTQASEDEYRGVYADTGVIPREIWRIKYYYPGVWNGEGAAKAFDNYSYGLHRRAYGNTLWCARFTSEQEATQAIAKVAAAARLRKTGTTWTGEQPSYGFQKESSGPLSLWQQGDWLLMSTLRDAETKVLQAK